MPETKRVTRTRHLATQETIVHGPSGPSDHCAGETPLPCRGARSGMKEEEDEAPTCRSPWPDEEGEETAAPDSGEDDDQTAALRAALRDCQERLGAAHALLDKLRAEGAAQKKLNDASSKMMQKRLAAALACRRSRAPRSSSAHDVCAAALDALDALEAQLPRHTGARIKGEFRRVCLLALHPDKAADRARAADDREVECLRALQEEWRRRDDSQRPWRASPPC